MISFDFNEIAGLVINLGAVGAFIYGVYRALRNWVQKAAQEAATASRVVQKQLRTSNGKTIAEYVERSAHTLDQLVAEVAANRAKIEEHIASHARDDATAHPDAT